MVSFLRPSPTGVRNMPPYAHSIPVDDRWAIVAVRPSAAVEPSTRGRAGEHGAIPVTEANNKRLSSRKRRFLGASMGRTPGALAVAGGLLAVVTADPGQTGLRVSVCPVHHGHLHARWALLGPGSVPHGVLLGCVLATDRRGHHVRRACRGLYWRCRSSVGSRFGQDRHLRRVAKRIRPRRPR